MGLCGNFGGRANWCCFRRHGIGGNCILIQDILVVQRMKQKFRQESTRMTIRVVAL